MTARPIPQNLPVEEARALLKDHFTGFSVEKYGEGWSELWNRGNFLPWDRPSPSPALTDTLVNHADVIGGPFIEDENGQKRRKRALVPGCGRGVDVMLLQSFGYDVVGLEYSQTAKEAAEQYAKEKANDPMYAIKDEKVGKGNRTMVQGDFYKDDWLESVGLTKNTKFELIYDYTFFCAMRVSMRPAWAKRMSDLLAHTSQANLICLEFPTTKPMGAGGPPFSSPPQAYMEHLSHPGEEIPYTAQGEVVANSTSRSGPGALERVGHWHPADAHAIGKSADGKVQDFIAIWRHS